MTRDDQAREKRSYCGLGCTHLRWAVRPRVAVCSGRVMIEETNEKRYPSSISRGAADEVPFRSHYECSVYNEQVYSLR